LVLHEQGRHDLAEKELRQHLVAEPSDGFAHALLAVSLLEQGQREAADQTAREAIAHAPDLAFAHYVLARVLSDRNHEDEASAAIQEAIRLEPTDADYHGMNAAILFDCERWNDALAAANTGLQCDPEHVACNNLRAMSLVRLGRKAEAGETISATLARDPDNSASHATKGWTDLEQGQRHVAMEHFRESLRLDPTNDWARSGLVEAIKAGNPIYSVMLKYFLWMQKLSDQARWGFILGAYFGNRLLRGASKANSELAPWILPLQVLYGMFVLMTWLAQPIFNLMLFMHPMGRHALNKDQRSQALWVGLSLFLCLAFLGPWIVSGYHSTFLIPALVFGLLAIPVASVFICEVGWPRRVMAAITFFLAATGLIAVVTISVMNPEQKSLAGFLGMASFVVFLVGSFASQWIANWLATQKPRR
jgi:tetratricopeptide (TPR) repeat protein